MDKTVSAGKREGAFAEVEPTPESRNDKSFIPTMTSEDQERSWIKPIRQMSPLKTNQNGMLALFK